MKTKNRPKYHVIQNVFWMIGIAWRTRKSVLFITVFSVMIEIILNLLQLYVAPEILSKVEEQVSLGALLGTIAFFTISLFLVQGIKAYLNEVKKFPNIEVRSTILGMIAEKCNNTSFVNTLEADFIRLREKAHMAVADNDRATESIWKVLTELLINTSGFVIYLMILSYVNKILLLIVILTCQAGFLISRSIDNWLYAHRKEEEDYYAKKTYIRNKSQSVEFAKDIRIFGLQSWMNELLKNVHDLYLDYRVKVEKKMLMTDVVEALFTMLRNGLAYAYLIYMVLNNEISVPEFILYFTAVSTFTTWLMGIMRNLARLYKESLDICKVREFLEFSEPFVFKEGKRIDKTDQYELQLKNVSYRYPGAESDTIHQMNLTIHPGENLAIVGLNGAGKTTLVRLLCGLLDPTEGYVLLNGIDVRGFHREEYYQLFSTVFQEFSVLDVTVAENIAQTTEKIDYEKLNKCMENAGIKEYVEELPQGTNTHVGKNVYLDGVLFSGGQLQRLMLARALYKDGAILVLDEPTAALDPIAENDIYLKYHDMTKGKTSIFISHRLASTRFCDRIIFMEHGKIKEEGTHESLLEKDGAYARLFEVQSRYYREGRDF